MYYLPAFRSIANEIQSIECVELIEFQTSPGVDNANASLPILPTSIADFLRESNGLQLHWEAGSKEGYIHLSSLEEVVKKESELPDWICIVVLPDGNEIGIVHKENDLSPTLYLKVENHLQKINALHGIESLFAFLISCKGYLGQQNQIFYDSNLGYEDTQASLWKQTPPSFSFSMLSNSLRFPQCDLLGHSMNHLNQVIMHQRALQSKEVNQTSVVKALDEHAKFIHSGGAGGRWICLHLKGISTGIYEGPEAKIGRQAQFEYARFNKSVSFRGALLAFSNFCGTLASDLDFSGAELSFCLFTDGQFQQSNFENAQLRKADFSRANLQKASFKNADLTGADFENAVLIDADFSGAVLEGARFPGAVF